MFEKEYLESFGTKIKARINIKKEEPIFSFVFFSIPFNAFNGKNKAESKKKKIGNCNTR